MKILLVTASLIDAGGAERVITTMANYWAERGREVILATLDDGKKEPFYPVNKLVRLEHLDIFYQSPHALASVVNNLKRSRRIRRCILENDADAVISFLAKTNVRTLLAALNIKVPVIVSERNHPAFSSIDPLTGFLRSRLYPRADYVVCQTGGILDYFLPSLEHNGVVIANPVLEPKSEGKVPAGVLPPGKLLLAAGSMSKEKVHQKGFDLLLKAFGVLEVKHGDWSLVVLGDGPQRKYLVQQVEEAGLGQRIFFPGNVKEIGAVFKRADLFCLSSRYEGFPNVLGEAMACGLPVVSFDCPTGPADLVRHGTDGLLVPAEDVLGLQSALSALMEDGGRREEMGNRAAEVTGRFSLDSIMSRWEELLGKNKVFLPGSASGGGGSSSGNNGSSGDNDSERVSNNSDSTGINNSISTGENSNGSSFDTGDIDSNNRGTSSAGGKEKIAIFLASLRGGGAERAMLTLAGCFKKFGIEVDLVLVAAEGPYLDEVPGGVRIVDLKKRRAAASIRALAGYLRRERPAALLSAMSHVNAAAVLAAGMAGVKNMRLVLSERNTASIAAGSSRSLRWRLMPLVSRFVYGRADRVVAVSEGVREDLVGRVKIPSSLVEVIYNPVVTEDLQARAAADPGHPWLDKSAQVPVILAAGRLSPEKGFDVLIEAFATVCTGRRAKLIILGEGEQRAALEELTRRLGLEDLVSMPGFKNNPYAFMSRADLFVLSSAYEGLPNVLIQAMACGCPVVSTDCPSGPAEILEGGRYGRLVPVGDSGAMAAAILESLDETVNSEALREGASRFRAEDIAGQYLNLLLPGRERL